MKTNYDAIFAKIAKEHNTTPAKVKKEIEEVLRLLEKSENPGAKELIKKVSTRTAEGLVEALARQTQENH